MAANVAGLVMLDPKMAKNVVDVTNILKEGLGDPFFTGTHQNGSYQWGARMPKLDEVAILETFKEDWSWGVHGWSKEFSHNCKSGYSINFIHVEDCWHDATNGSCEVTPKPNPKGMTTQTHIKINGIAMRGVHWKVHVYEVKTM